jgi:hypothetical protein
LTGSAKAVALSSYVHGSSYNKAQHRVDCCLWICCCRRPYAIIEDPELRNIFTKLHAPVETPSASTMSRDVKEIFGYTKDNIIEVLAAVEGKIHLTADGWTSPNTIAFLGVTVQFVRDGKLVTFPLDFIKYVMALVHDVFPYLMYSKIDQGPHWALPGNALRPMPAGVSY